MINTSAQPIAKLLIVDDEAAQMTALCRTLEDEGYATTGYTSPRKALEALREQEFDLVLTDLMMPDIDGIEFLTEGHKIDRNLVAVVMTGHGAVDTAVQAMQAGALDYIQKPFKLRDVLPVLTRALTVRRLRMENIQLRESVAIQSLSSEFTQDLNLRALVSKVTDTVFQQSDGGAVALLTVSADGRSLQVAAARSDNEKSVEGLSFDIDDTIKSWLAKTREQLTSASTWAADDFHLEYPHAALNYFASMPMLTAGDLVGILAFSSGPPQRSVTVGQLKTLCILASSAAAAMGVASLLQRLQHANDELEERVAQRTQELEAANRELEAFSYTISHDLRAPVRTITGYADLLLDPEQPLPSEAIPSVNGIRLASTRMAQLISDLLALSQSGRHALQMTTVWPAILVQQVLTDLQPERDKRQINVSVGDLPQCVADASLLKQVIVNLLTNAFKFTKKSNPATIEIGATKGEGEVTYFVRDNGAGFDMTYANKLFAVFERLHTTSEFEGTGIGLSIVQRIIARHGGRIWAEGQVGKGATFYFSLPHLQASTTTAAATASV